MDSSFSSSMKISSSIPKHILPVIVFSQFAGTSLWFAGNAVVPELIAELGLLEMFVGFITMAVQSGFIIGTLVFAVLSVFCFGSDGKRSDHLQFKFYRSNVRTIIHRIFSSRNLSRWNENRFRLA